MHANTECVAAEEEGKFIRPDKSFERDFTDEELRCERRPNWQ